MQYKEVIYSMIKDYDFAITEISEKKFSIEESLKMLQGLNLEFGLCFKISKYKSQELIDEFEVQLLKDFKDYDVLDSHIWEIPFDETDPAFIVLVCLQPRLNYLKMIYDEIQDNR